ncbi:uncharacterized protein LOC123534267 [Mercenaria mercenaria]|uniref:uncharacterized protein LOC123534267 n=1 Tax=Mercenaria mercenaria TaxID=6596 RepID=UPI00234F27E5|nr:uncharacterized protein LOC123534267 [Mercenaria mercenaria]
MKCGFYLFFLWCMTFCLQRADAAYGKTEVKDGDVIRPRMNILKKKYLKNTDQTWTLVANTGHWALVFHYLSIEKSSNCQHDYLEIQEHDYNMSDTVHAPTRYCGEITPMPYISKTSRITVRFISDNIWELKGFNITAIYGEQKEALESKVHEMLNKYTITLALEAEEKNEDSKDSKGAIFYVLIGSSVAALVLFFILLAYFVIAMRKQIYTHKTRVPKLYYISGASQTNYRGPSPTRREPFVRLNSGTPALKSPQELCKTGKRYSKEKKAAKPVATDTTAVKFVEPSCRCQHNNLYVSNALVHVCRN